MSVISSCSQTRAILMVRGRHRKGVLTPKHKHDLHGSRALSAASGRRAGRSSFCGYLPHSRAAWFPVSGAHRGHVERPASPPPNRWICDHARQRSPCLSAGWPLRRVFIFSAWAMCALQPLVHLTISAAAPGVPSPKFAGSTHARIFSMCAFYHAALRQCHEHLGQCYRAQLSRRWLLHLLSTFSLCGSRIRWCNRCQPSAVLLFVLVPPQVTKCQYSCFMPRVPLQFCHCLAASAFLNHSFQAQPQQPLHEPCVSQSWLVVAQISPRCALFLHLAFVSFPVHRHQHSPPPK